jgi:glutaredoxin
MVILHTNNCPKCKILKSKLDEREIVYTINTDVILMQLKGFTSAPMLEVNEKTMNYLEAVNWIKEQN